MQQHKTLICKCSGLRTGFGLENCVKYVFICMYNYNFQVYRQCQKLKECTSWYLQFMDLKTFNCVAKSTCRTEHLYAEIKLQLNAWTCPCFERSVHLSTWAHFQQPWLLNSTDILCYVCRCLLVFSVILTAGLSGSSFWALVDIHT